MTVVLDVSAVTEILLHGLKMDTYNSILQQASLVLAPDMYISELANTFWKYQTAKKITEEECLLHINDGLEYVNHFINSKELWQEAFHEAANHHHPVYDMFYAIAARRQSGALITNDGPLADICKQLKIPVVFDIEA
jgi:predicted nucleic acid-binding protein